MTTLNCAAVRDLLPEHAGGSLAAPAAAGVDAHLAVCTECGTEAALVALLARHPVIPPAGLEARIIGAVRRPPARRTFWAPARVALAATVAGALLTGDVLVRELGFRPVPSAQVSLAEEAVQSGALTWLAEPALSGGPALHELSVAELEALLLELES